MARFQILLVSGSAIAALASCTPALPGESLGTFEVTMKMDDNTCGEGAVYTMDGQKLSVELRSKKDECYWRVPGHPIMQGTLKDDGSCQFSVTTVVASDAQDQTESDQGLMVPDPTKPQVDMPQKAVCQLVQTAQIVTTIEGTPLSDAGVGGGDAGEGDAGAGRTLTATYDLAISPSSAKDCADALVPDGPFKTLPCSVSYSLTGGERDSF
jgi:hypothetical protein